jgi:hypothetical protein
MTAPSTLPYTPRWAQTHMPAQSAGTHRDEQGSTGHRSPIARIMLAPVLWLGGILGAATVTTAFLLACAASAR